MVLRVAVGKENFDILRKGGSYYVDKTELIYELIHDKDNTVTLFTRPRRFGKTLTLSMMESFFDITRDSREVFAGLAVTGHGEFCEEWMNQYPVLMLSLKDVAGRNFDVAYKKLKATIAELCANLAYLSENDRVSPSDISVFQKLQEKTADEEEVQNALKTIMRMMKSAYGRQVILLMDEYDVPLAKARENGFYEEMLDVIRGMMSASLKSNDHLKFGVITGCLRIAKESIFTGTNNFVSYSVLDEEFSPYFGFTQEEVADLLAAADRSEKAEAVKAWYDGYIFGDSRVYCPWDVVSYVSALLKRPNARPKNYWKNTSGNDVIRAFVGMEEFSVSDKFERLLNGGTIVETITDEMTYDQLYRSERNLWSVLLMTGYLTKCDGEETDGVVELRIPNREIAGIFRECVVDYFTDTLDQSRLQSLMDCLWNGDEEGASGVMSDLLWETISYNDYHEDYYHAFLAGLFVGRGYEVESNKEHGLGRPDILLKDKRNRRAILIEAKRSGKRSDMDSDCRAALAQIADRQYTEDLMGYKTILCYGAAFFRKTALVKKL